MERPLRIVSLMEATTITGVAKALLAFYKTARTTGLADISLVTFVRTTADEKVLTNSFIQTMEALQFSIDVIPERSALDLAAIRSLRRIVDRTCARHR